MLAARVAVDLLPASEDIAFAPAVPVLRSHEANRAVKVLRVVPEHEGFDPRVVKYEDHERGLGDWNVTDLYVMGPDSLHVVNRKLDLRAFNARTVEAGGGERPGTSHRLLGRGA